MKRSALFAVVVVLFTILASRVSVDVGYSVEENVVDWPLWVYPTSTGGDTTASYIDSFPDEWVSQSWDIPVDFTYSSPRIIHVTIQNRGSISSLSDIHLTVALTPLAYSAMSSVEVSPSTTGTKLASSFILVDASHIPRGFSFGEHIYKNQPSAKCYYYEFHVSNALGKKDSTALADHVDVTVTLHMKSGISCSPGMYVHFDCSAVVPNPGAIVVNPTSRDSNAWQSLEFIIPEVPVGTILVAATALATFAAYSLLPKRKTQLP